MRTFQNQIIMRPYTKIYLETMSYDESDFIPCELCHSKAVDIHHIECRGMGGSKGNNVIENLMALCRSCHVKFGDKKKYINIIKDIHLERIRERNPNITTS